MWEKENLWNSAELGSEFLEKKNPGKISWKNPQNFLGKNDPEMEKKEWKKRNLWNSTELASEFLGKKILEKQFQGRKVKFPGNK